MHETPESCRKQRKESAFARYNRHASALYRHCHPSKHGTLSAILRPPRIYSNISEPLGNIQCNSHLYFVELVNQNHCKFMLTYMHTPNVLRDVKSDRPWSLVILCLETIFLFQKQKKTLICRFLSRLQLFLSKMCIAHHMQYFGSEFCNN